MKEREGIQTGRDKNNRHLEPLPWRHREVPMVMLGQSPGSALSVQERMQFGGVRFSKALLIKTDCAS